MAYNPFDDVILQDPAYMQPPQKFFVGGAVRNLVQKLLKNASNDEVNQLRQFLTDSDQALKLKPGEYAPDYYAFHRDEPAYQYFEDLYAGGVGDLGDASAAQKIQNTYGYDFYKKNIQNYFKKELGDEFVGYRLTTKKDLDSYLRGDKSAFKPTSFSLDPKQAIQFANFANPRFMNQKTMNPRDDLVLIESPIRTESIVMRGRPDELEIVSDTTYTSANELRVYDPRTGEILFEPQMGPLKDTGPLDFGGERIKKVKDQFNQGGPVYMAEGGDLQTTDQGPNLLQSALKPIQKVGEFFEPGLMYAGEAMMNAPYQFGKLLDTDKTTKERYQETMQDPKSFVQGLKTFMIPIEALGEGLTYLFNPQDIRETRLKLASGEAEPVERIAAQIGATFELLGAGELFKIIGRKFGPDIVNSLQKQNLQSPQEIINALPVSGKEKVEFAKEVYGGMGLPTKPPGMETSQILSKADDGGAGGTGAFSEESLLKSRESFKQNKYEPYRNAFNKFIKGKDSINVSEFRDYLKNENVPFTVASGTKDTKKAKDNLNQHLNNALNYLTEGTNVKVKSAAFKPWMTEAENILRENPDGIYPSAISKLLKERGFNVDRDRIRQWGLKGENVEDKTVLNNLKSGSQKQQIQDEKVIEIKKILDQLENDPKLRGKGAAKYKFTISSDGKTYTIESALAKKAAGIQSALGDDVINKLREYTFKPNEPLGMFFEYIPRYSKDIFETKDAKKYNRALDNIFQSFRSGMLGKYNNFEDGMQAYGIQKKTGNKAEDLIINEENRKKILALNADINKYNRLGGAEKKQYEKIFDDSVLLSNYTLPKWKETVLNNPQLRDRVLEQWRTINPNATLEEAISEAGKAFAGHVSHIARISKFAGSDKEFEAGLRGMGALGSMVRVNFGIENLALQRTAENIIEEGVKILNRLTKKEKTGNLTDKEQDTMFRIAANIGYYNNLMKTKGMAAYMRIPKTELTDDVMNYLNNYFKARGGPNLTPSDQVIAKTIAPKKGDNIAEKYNDIFIGTEVPQTLDQQKARFDDLMNFYINNPQEFTFSKQSPKFNQDIVEGFGETPYIRYAFPNTARPIIERETSFKKGGPVKMAVGGDPLINMNQQQYSPDPAFDEDYFQQAVDSGNLQAANLFNLFKVFKKPKVMATPSNIKQVEEANQAMPQAVPGSQEIAPMQPGRPDFFFKSFLLDQLNSKNAPKASTPKGWREFLIKGRNVPEAEMLDTGILQYLEDTEKFYPQKKITREEIENLYDMSPLGNLEVRVKPVRGYPEGENVPQESYEFFADQGTQKHRGVGRASIDNAAEEYFEVVVNVPNLPGQEKAFINSSHFEEPNVLGFTRVGTYKNSNNETVAVIQEMQTDMLTEVRKEQERLSAMVKALRRYRDKLVNDINTMPPQNTGYYENELRVFDQKYPPDRLAALESDNLIKPFPNIVAKDLIPEKTRSLNQIQEDINQLSMANVEQYRDPAYKTKIFDLAQEQQNIVNDLMSMNRSSNYEEMLKDFKVPSTTDRSELDRIANNDTYLPSDYQLKPVQSFPPIPFNKQADYVDLLIKSTIKAAKQKGIDKVAIMPADVGPNPRWGKDSDEAKKKFQNLYDKVGVQQLKNIAKKYGGKLEVEKIIDSSKGTKGLTFLNKNPDGEFQILKQAETRKEIPDADRDQYYDEQITRVVKGITEPGDVVYSREIAPGQVMDYYLVEGRGDATDVGYRMIPLKEGENANDALIKIEEYNPSAVDMYTLSFDPSKLEEPMYLFKKKSGGSIDKDSLVSITDIYGEYGR